MPSALQQPSCGCLRRLSDPLRGLPKLKVCVAYKLKNGETVTEFPANFMDLVDCEPVYEEFDGFDEDITNCRSFEELPATVQSYIKELF